MKPFLFGNAFLWHPENKLLYHYNSSITIIIHTGLTLGNWNHRLNVLICIATVTLLCPTSKYIQTITIYSAEEQPNFILKKSIIVGF